MKTKLLILILSLMPIFASAKDYFIIAVKTDSTTNDIALIEQMMTENIDKQYVCTNSVVYTKKGPPDNNYYLACYDVEDRKFNFKADNAIAWINSHSGDFDNPNNIVVMTKLNKNVWVPYIEPE